LKYVRSEYPNPKHKTDQRKPCIDHEQSLHNADGTKEFFGVLLQFIDRIEDHKHEKVFIEDQYVLNKAEMKPDIRCEDNLPHHEQEEQADHYENETLPCCIGKNQYYCYEEEFVQRSEKNGDAGEVEAKENEYLICEVRRKENIQRRNRQQVNDSSLCNAWRPKGISFLYNNLFQVVAICFPGSVYR
jgi:hypothetical protein